MKKTDLFYVEMKNKSGEYEPLGVTTMADAFETEAYHEEA